jgi:hypothetical protein
VHPGECRCALRLGPVRRGGRGVRQSARRFPRLALALALALALTLTLTLTLTLDDFLDFHPGLASHEKYAALLANRAACHLAQRDLPACEADCAAALGGGAPLAPKQHAKLLLRRAEALRLQGRLEEAADDLRSTSRLVLDPPTRALLVAAEEQLEAQEAEAAADAPATSPEATGGEAEPAGEEAAAEEAAAKEAAAELEAHTVPAHQVSVESGDGGKRSVVINVELPEVSSKTW